MKRVPARLDKPPSGAYDAPDIRMIYHVTGIDECGGKQSASLKQQPA
jgi:hypothetical protein